MCVFGRIFNFETSEAELLTSQIRARAETGRSGELCSPALRSNRPAPRSTRRFLPISPAPSLRVSSAKTSLRRARRSASSASRRTKTSPRVARSRPPPWGWGAERACSRSSPRASRARVRLLPERPVPRVRPSSRLPDAADKDSHNPDGGKPTLLIRAVRMASSPRDQDHAARRDTERRFRHLRSLRLQRAHYACACADAEVAALLLDYYQYYPHATAARAGAGALRVDHVARAVRSATTSAAAAAAAGAADAPRAAPAAPSTEELSS